MKFSLKSIVCAALLAVAPTIASAQVGYSVADFNGTAPQRLYRFDVNDGIMEDLGTIETNTEQEGLFSVGSLLFGYSENDPALATEDQRTPGTRILPFPGSNAPNLIGSGENANRRVCSAGPAAAFGSEAGAAFNPVDGYVYVVNSNDNPADGVVGSRFFRFKPGCVGFQQVGAQTSTYIDGLAVSPGGTIYASDARLTDRVYTLSPSSGALSPIGSFGIPTNLDSGLAWDFENNRLLMLLETGLIYQINITSGAATLITTLTLNGQAAPRDLEGFDIPLADPIP